MAGTARQTTPALEDLYRALADAPHGTSFYEAVRRIDCTHPERPRTGHAVRPGDEPVRFAQEPSLAFAPSTLAAFDTATGGRPPRLEVLFFGLLGPNGPLPLHVTEFARDRLRNSRDPTFTRFLDLFHHRMLSLFYRAWASAQPTVSLDRPAADRFAAYVGSLIGTGTPALRDRDAMPDQAKLHYAGHLAAQSRHAAGLDAMLADFFRLPVRIQECVGQWLALPEESLCRLGESEATGTLGVNAVAGAEVWETQVKFRVVFGPIDHACYQRLLPGGATLRRLVDLVRNYVGDQFDWDVNLVLEAAEVPPLQLGVSGQLGWTTWLTSGPLGRDADELCLNPADHAKRVFADVNDPVPGTRAPAAPTLED